MGDTAKKRRVTPEIKAAAIRLHEQGKSNAEIARELNIWPSAVGRWFAEAPHERAAAMRDLRRQGLTYEEIGARFGVNRQRVAALMGELPRVPTRGDRRQINVATGTWDGVQAVAADLGLLVSKGPDHGKGSIALLLDAIGQGEVRVAWKRGHGPDTPSKPDPV